MICVRPVREDQRGLHVVPGAHGDCTQARRRPHAARVHPPHRVSSTTLLAADNEWMSLQIKYFFPLHARKGKQYPDPAVHISTLLKRLVWNFRWDTPTLPCIIVVTYNVPFDY